MLCCESRQRCQQERSFPPLRYCQTSYGEREQGRDQNTGWGVLPYPNYSTDVFPSDDYLFIAMGNHLREQQFRNRYEITKTVTQVLESKKKKDIFLKRAFISL